MSTSFSLASAKQQATALRRRLAELGQPLSHGQALEAVAASHGFADWNRLAAHVGTAPSAKPERVVQALFAKTGDAASAIFRMLAMAMIDDAPKGNVWILHPYPVAPNAEVDMWKQAPSVNVNTWAQARTLVQGQAVEQITAKATSFSHHGRIFQIGPDKSHEDPKLLMAWLQGLLASWKTWEGSKRTQAIMLMDSDWLLYEMRALAPLLADLGVPVFVHAAKTKTVNSLGDHCLLEVFTMRHSRTAAEILLYVGANEYTQAHLVGFGEEGFTHEELGTLPGMLRLTSCALAKIATRPIGDNPRYERFMAWCQEELEVYREHDARLVAQDVPINAATEGTD